MRLRLTPVLILLAAGAASAQEPLRPAPSGRGSSEVRLSPPRPQGTEPDPAADRVVKLDYGQPHLRGRALYTDSLVPYDRPWRVGANAATTLSTDVDLVIGGLSVPKGSYVLFALPARTGWKLIVQKSVGQNAEYDVANDIGRVDLRRRALSSPIESLTMWLIPSMQPGPARGELRFAWGTEELSTTWSVK
jgi:hypothetical protein